DALPISQGFETRRVAKLRNAGAAQQRAQRRVTKCRSVEFCQMGVAPGGTQQYGIAEIIQRPPVAGGRQGTPCRAGELLKTHLDSLEIPIRPARRVQPRAIGKATRKGHPALPTLGTAKG